jgi:DNA mismatch endonuclease (patch repair protein)
MSDVLTREQRRRNMAAIRSKNTKPEMVVRRLVHSLGFRFRLHRSDLPGKPDLTFPKMRKVIFVHGCFWHMHDCPYGRVSPKSNAEFWARKRQSNVERDNRAVEVLATLGWQMLIIWECETRNLQNLQISIVSFLGPRGK